MSPTMAGWFLFCFVLFFTISATWEAYKYVHINMHVCECVFLHISAVLYKITKDWKYSKYPSIKDSVHTLGFYALKNKEEMLQADVERSQEYIIKGGIKSRCEIMCMICYFLS